MERSRAQTSRVSEAGGITLLDGLGGDAGPAARMRRAILAGLEAPGAPVRHFRLDGTPLSPCLGCFQCWLRTPGLCIKADAPDELAREAVRSRLLVLATPVTFGGYGFRLKRAVDGLLPNLSPFFQVVEGRTHHRPRYPRYPSLLAVGLMGGGDGPGSDPAGTFARLVDRNRVNLHAPRARALVVDAAAEAADAAGEIRRAVQGLLAEGEPGEEAGAESLLGPESLLPGPPPAASFRGRDDPVGPPRAVVWSGSPRRASTSLSLGQALGGELARRGWVVDPARNLHRALRHPEEWKALADALTSADLVILASPIYVDALPSGVVEAMERLRAEGAAPVSLAVLLNCGFPEPQHGEVALEICRHFAREVGWGWRGGVTLGGGEAIHGRPLEQMGGLARNLRAGLDRLAEGLATQGAIPAQAYDLFARPLLPPWAYRILGGMGWRVRAARLGTFRALDSQPWLDGDREARRPAVGGRASAADRPGPGGSDG